MPGRAMIYGSGKAEVAQQEVTGEEKPAPAPVPDPLTFMGELLMAPLAMLTGQQVMPETQKAAARYTRAYLPQGGVKPTMTTAELNRRNIFGAGGGY